MQRNRLALVTTILQIILLLICIGNLLIDRTSFAPRLVVFLCSLSATLLVSPRYILWLLAPCLWLEIPTLRLGFPNQFLSDIMLLGWTLGLGIRFRKKIDRTERLITHPYLLTILAVALTASFYFLMTLMDTNSLFPDGFSKKKLVLTILRGIFDWDVESPLHNASVIIGYFIQVLFITRLILHRDEIHLSSSLIYSVLALAAAINAMYGIGQVLWPSQFPAIYTVDKGGLLQNGNHLSFICCLAFLGIPILAKEAKEQWARILLFFSCAILLCGIIIGRGRLPWISLGTVLFLFVMWALRVSTEPIYRWLKVQHIFWGIILALSCVVALRISGAWVESDFFNIFSEIPKTVRTEGWTKLLFVGGRGPHFLVAADALAQNPYFGIGIDSFFAKTTLSLSIHSLFFQWIVGLGLVGSIAWFFTLSISAMSAIRCIIRMKRLNISLTISMLSLLFMAMTHLGDVFAAYRSMFAFCSLVSTAFWLELQPHSKEKDSPFICSLVLISVSSSILALLSWNSPQSIPLYSFHRSEHDQAKTFTWNGLFRHVFLPPGICTRFEVSTPIRRQGQILKAAFVPEGSEPPSFVNRVQLANWESLHNVKPATSLQSGQWIPICTCAPYNEIGTLYLSSKYGEILSASREEFGYDDRFIGFGVANPLTFDRSDGNLSQFCKDAITLLPN